jgi:hypothetical protein
MTAINILTRARDILIYGGWCQGQQAQTRSGRTAPVGRAHRYTLEGAILCARITQGSHSDQQDAFKAVHDVIGNPDWDALQNWNDVPGRDLGDVIRLLDWAIQRVDIEAKKQAA